jgi:oleandomycin transport system ATP-binding protein
VLPRQRDPAGERAAELLARSGLEEVADRPVATYSGGMRRRLDLAAALVGRPEVVFLDEPSVGLDPGRREELWQVVRELAAAGSSVLLTTQYLEEADALADTLAVVDRGRVIAAGTPAELKRRVGGHTVVVRPASPADLDRASAILAEVTGRPPAGVRPHELVAPVRGEGEFFALTARFASEGIGVGELSLRLPSLDEVFRSLTAAGGQDAA